MPEFSLEGFTLLDLVLVVVLLGYLVAGLRNGFLVTLGGIVGFVAGAVAAFFAIPLVSGWVPDAPWRLIAVIATVIVLVIVGQSVGSALGASIRRWSDFPPLRVIDRLLGGVVNVVVAALVLSMLAFSVSSLGVPFLSQQLAASQVIRGIDTATPGPVRTWMAQLRTLAVDDGIPTILESVGPVAPAEVPDASVDTPELAAAASSVVRITGTAFQCGQNQTGSGFVVAPDRVVTNAHVVAGVDEPVVEVPGAGALPGRVVSLDTARDIAVIAVEGLPAAALQLGDDLDNGATAAFAGYPAGGPYRIQPASVQNLSPVLVNNIYGADPQPLQVYSLAANVQQGNSGGPLLDLQGRVTGVVFAKSTANAPVGYALSLEELRPIAESAPQLNDAVSAGQCTRG
ncbi:MarP family serine protease [Arthrobacter agilis]|uniref:MarP family serine protease n=1 Tax=Arthrobacter agilis TaxID=37921 RepID=UPI000B35EE22|nr:MarP family serine protease [Arthrobacter agilis]OUM43038.1 serine protease [Arthrobacter agilis]PPB45982.1 serine protease [Arthrobacter agilis]TPV25520.1 MarP family serine protease [Arthrobacter agilis]VDR33277.1 Serine protease Rv3671c [Arthrobacter agilis]